MNLPPSVTGEYRVSENDLNTLLAAQRVTILIDHIIEKWACESDLPDIAGEEWDAFMTALKEWRMK